MREKERRNEIRSYEQYLHSKQRSRSRNTRIYTKRPLFPATRGHHLFFFFLTPQFNSNFPEMPLPAEPRRCRPHRTKSDADWRRGVSVTPSPARSLPPSRPRTAPRTAGPAPSRPRVDGRFCPWPLRGRGARIRLVPIWCGPCGSIRPDDSDPLPSTIPSRSLALHAGDRRRGRAGDAHGHGDGESFPTLRLRPAPQRRAR